MEEEPTPTLEASGQLLGHCAQTSKFSEVKTPASQWQVRIRSQVHLLEGGLHLLLTGLLPTQSGGVQGCRQTRQHLPAKKTSERSTGPFVGFLN